MNVSIEEIVRQAMDFMQNELATVEGLVANACDRRARIQEALDEPAAPESGLPLSR